MPKLLFFLIIFNLPAFIIMFFLPDRIDDNFNKWLDKIPVWKEWIAMIFIFLFSALVWCLIGYAIYKLWFLFNTI